MEPSTTDGQPWTQSVRERLNSRTLLSGAMAAVALAGIGFCWLRSGVTLQAPGGMVAILLVLAIVVSYRFPIHIRLSSKLYIGSAVLYLAAVLLPPALAATIAALGVLVGQLSIQDRTRNHVSVLITGAARWGIIELLGALVAHLPPGTGEAHILPLVSCAVVLWTGDLLTNLALYASRTRERARRLLFPMVKQGGMPEAAQYLVGLIAALEVPQHLWTLGLFVVPVALVYATFKHSQEMHDETRKILESMADTVDLRDPYTGGHSRRVTELTLGILRELVKRGPEADLIVAAARVHDIGKIAIPDALLRKPDRLTPAERAIMQTHAARGADLLKRYQDFARGVAIVRHHHEAWDGSGYPDGLKGTDIPIGARVIAVADSYDAMTSDRPYRPAMSPQQAALVLAGGRNKQWDGMIVDAFLRSIADRLRVSDRPALHLVEDDADRHGSHRTG